MSYIKRAIEEIQGRGWPVNDESLKRLEDTILKEHGKKFRDWIIDKNEKDDQDRKVYKDGEIR